MDDIASLSRSCSVSTGDRSAKIRTYNLSAGRARSPYRLYPTRPEGFLGGNIQDMIDARPSQENAENEREPNFETFIIMESDSLKE